MVNFNLVESNDMLISVILDRSGSMAGRVDSVIEHFNAYKDEVSQLPNVRMSIYQFDDQYETIVDNKPIHEVPNLTREVYSARGWTALLDAVGRTIANIDSIIDKPNKIIVVINTDGFENYSREYHLAQIKNLIADRQAQGWQFVFVGAGIDAFSTGTSWGIRGNSTWTAPNTDWGYGSTYTVLSAATMDFASGASSTVNMVKSGIDLGIEQGTEEPPLQLTDPKKKKGKVGSNTR